MAMVFKMLFVGGAKIQPFLADAALTVLRVFTGFAMAYAHGWGKVPPAEGFVSRVSTMGFPAPEVFAWSAALSEFLGGILLMLGLVTRPAAAAIFGTMVVAGFIAHSGDTFRERELALLFGAIALAFVFVGSGRYSVDRFIRGH